MLIFGDGFLEKALFVLGRLSENQSKILRYVSTLHPEPLRILGKKSASFATLFPNVASLIFADLQ